MAQVEVSVYTIEAGWTVSPGGIEVGQDIIEIGFSFNPPLATSQSPVEVGFRPGAPVYGLGVSQHVIEVAFRYLPYTGNRGIYVYGVAHG